MPGKIEWTTRWLLALAAVELVLAALAAASMDRNEGFPRYLGLYLAMSVPWLAASHLAVRERDVQRSDTALVLGVAVLLRALFITADPVLSDDIFRYVWDGRVQHSGVNPYFYAPDDTNLVFLRQRIPDIYAGINNKAIPTIYPPVMQLLFFAATSVSSSLLWMKALLTFLDLVLVYALARLLAALRLPPRRALIYAWSPLSLVEIAGSGHNDVAAVLFLVLALWAFEKGRGSGALGLATASGLAKVGGFALLPFFGRFVNLRRYWIVPVAAVVTALPYASAGGLAFRGLTEYALRWRANDSLFHILVLFTDSLPEAKLVVLAILGALALVLFGRKTSPVRAAFWIFGTILLLSPTVHPWYLLWIAPLLAVFPHPGWLFLEASVALSYHAAYLAAPGEPWQEIPWVKLLEYGPFFLLLGLHLALHGSRKNPEGIEGGRAR